MFSIGNGTSGSKSNILEVQSSDVIIYSPSKNGYARLDDIIARLTLNLYDKNGNLQGKDIYDITKYDHPFDSSIYVNRKESYLTIEANDYFYCTPLAPNKKELYIQTSWVSSDYIFRIIENDILKITSSSNVYLNSVSYNLTYHGINKLYYFQPGYLYKCLDASGLIPSDCNWFMVRHHSGTIYASSADRNKVIFDIVYINDLVTGFSNLDQNNFGNSLSVMRYGDTFTITRSNWQIRPFVVAPYVRTSSTGFEVVAYCSDIGPAYVKLKFNSGHYINFPLVDINTKFVVVKTYSDTSATTYIVPTTATDRYILNDKLYISSLNTSLTVAPAVTTKFCTWYGILDSYDYNVYYYNTPDNVIITHLDSYIFKFSTTAQSIIITKSSIIESIGRVYTNITDFFRIPVVVKSPSNNCLCIVILSTMYYPEQYNGSTNQVDTSDMFMYIYSLSPTKYI